MIDWKPIDQFRYIGWSRETDYLFWNSQGAHVGHMMGTFGATYVAAKRSFELIHGVTHFAEIKGP